jgi:pilus assembly protein CpaE
MAVLDLSDRTYVVLDSIVPTVLGAVKLLQTLNRLGFPPERRRLVLNRYAGFTGDLRPADVALRLGQEIDHLLPYEKKLLTAANLGRPHILGAGRLFAPWARELRKLAGEIEELKPVPPAARARGTAPSDNGALDQEQVQK